jgi:hypothetical protein
MMPIVTLPLPIQLVDGTVADAVPVMADLNYIAQQVNLNAQPFGSVGAVEWQLLSATPTYVSATSFTVPGDVTATLVKARRLKTTNTGGTVYSTVLTSVFGVGVTTVTLVNDSGVLDSGISVVNYGILNSVNPSQPQRSGDTITFAHNTDAISSGTRLVLSSGAGCTVTGGEYFAFGEWNAATGVFTPGRPGLYLFSANCRLASTGVTFSGTSSILLEHPSGVGDVIGNGFFAPCSTPNVVYASCCVLQNFASGDTGRLSLTVVFSAGTPVLQFAGLSIVGPL